MPGGKHGDHVVFRWPRPGMCEVPRQCVCGSEMLTLIETQDKNVGCPTCGRINSHREDVPQYPPLRYLIICDSCQLKGPYGATVAEAFQLWNEGLPVDLLRFAADGKLVFGPQERGAPE